jgi:hypothetical protein
VHMVAFAEMRVRFSNLSAGVLPLDD